jgi:hypothetical protein
VQAVGANPDDWFRPWMELTAPIHQEYADRCGADYEFFAGDKEPDLNPTWTRLIQILDAFDSGYDKVVWLDADTLVVDLDRSVFTETDSETPLLMTRVLSSHLHFPWASMVDGELVWADRWDVYNDGVLIANRSPHAIKALEFAWENRRSPLRPWHEPGIPELDWLLDYVFANPEAVAQLDLAWNWMPYPEACPKDEAVILAWHGMPKQERWESFLTEYARVYG